MTGGTGAPAAPADAEGQRLSKAVAALLTCSRREAEQYIADGWVRVDGECVRTPQQRVMPGQRVEVDRQSRLQPVLPATLPLPTPASGLCVFSQAPGVLRKLTEDANLVEQEWVAEVQGSIAPGGLARLSHGLVWGGRPLPPAHVSWQSETRLRFAMKGIAPERVEWMCAQVGLRLQALRRIRIGRVPMAGLPVGQWRYLPAGVRF